MVSGNPRWPVVTRYDADHLERIALPLGGIGTGTVSLGGRGDLRDWEVVNRPAKGFAPRWSFAALWTPSASRALESVLRPPYEGAMGAVNANHGLPRFRHGEFLAAYPFGQVLLSDPAVPVQVRLEAFNPLVPADPERSGLPVAVLRYVLINPTDQPQPAAVCLSLENFVGRDGSAGESRGGRNVYREADGLRGLFCDSAGVDRDAEQWGSLALVTPSAGEVTSRTAWAQLSWGDTLLDFWDDWSEDGRLAERDGAGQEAPQASLAVAVEVPPGAELPITFLLCWHFPNRLTWTPTEAGPNRIGNWYTTRHADAWSAAASVAADLPVLERDTLAFVGALAESDLPTVVKDAALSNLTALRSQTTFRTEDGRMYAWEGCGDRSGCCHGTCTHVWNYEPATAHLFGSLARGLREIEFDRCTADNGLMSFRVHLPLSRAQEFGTAAADGQMGCLIKLYREWQLSGDDDWLRRLWPSARRAIEFCWIDGGWDADRDGVMEGCQHNTMDVEYFGPNPQMAAWYLGALRAGEAMARHLGEDAFADTCGRLFVAGRDWVDANLFNGEYYEHQVVPPTGPIAPGLQANMGATDLSEPELQLGAGCLVDQLVGQYLASLAGLGYLLEPDHVRATLEAIYRHNYKRDLFGQFNHMRSFALNDEAALVMATYPRGRRPKRPFPYFNEVMTGFEYAAAVHMLIEGQVEHGLECIAAIRARYDGARRSPFDEAECGHHYARAMASWGAVLALTGFHWSAVSGQMTFAAADVPVKWFWSTGEAWGTLRQTPDETGIDLELQVLGGHLKLRGLNLAGLGEARPVDPPRRWRVER